MTETIKFTPPTVTRDQIVGMNEVALWAILQSQNAMNETFCNQLCWAKDELRRRGWRY